MADEMDGKAKPIARFPNRDEISTDNIHRRRPSQAIIMSQMPSAQVHMSDTGLILGRKIAELPRRKSELIRRRKSVVHPSLLTGGELDGETIRRRMSMARSLNICEDIDSDIEQWQRRQSIKGMTASISVKRKYRDEIMQESVKKIGGVKSWRLRSKKKWQKFKFKAKNILSQLELWSGSFKIIEGRFGTAIMSYFRFVRWLMFLNLYMGVVMMGFIVIPHFILDGAIIYGHDTNRTDYVEQALNCSLQYRRFVSKNVKDSDMFSKVLDVLQGTGWLENTVLFYGKYVSIYKTPAGHPYNLELIYLLATGLTFLIGFFLLVKNSGKGIKEGVMEKDTKLLQFSNKVLTGWDYCITEPKAVHHKHKNLSQELEADLENQRLQWKKQRRTTQEKMKLFIIRFIINIIIIALLTVSLFLIYFTSTQLVELQKLLPYQHPLVKFTIQYLPSITITLLNVVVPVILRKLVLLEDYMPAFEIRMTLLRTVLLRLASLGVLLYSLYELIQLEDPTQMNKCGNKRWALNRNSSAENEEDSIGSIKCWETYVGQQIYKLILLDFLVFTIVTFVVEFPRRFIYDRFKRVKIIKMVGVQEFNLPKAVLDIVYSQTLCWMGLFFSPLIPIICCAKCFTLFYIKKLSLLQNYIPPVRPYRTSKSNSLFVTVLLISFLLSAIPLAYVIGNFQPSQSCGPFRIHQYAITVFYSAVNGLLMLIPIKLRTVIYFMGTSGFFIPVILFFCIIIFYYWMVAAGYAKMEKILCEQLQMEGKDKQFLLARVNEVCKKMDDAEMENILENSDEILDKTYID